VIVIERRWNGNDENIRRFDHCRSAEHLSGNDPLNQTVQIDFLDMDFATVDRFNDVRANIDAQNLAPRTGNYRCCGQADIPQSKYANVRLFVD
jgi:hypothetical protein